MMRRSLWLLVLLLIGPTCTAAEVFYDGAEGFGAQARGGAGGRELRVTTLEDDPADPKPGSLRWAVNSPGPRVVKFSIAGNIRLSGPLVVKEPFLTLDGKDAPGDGVCLCDHSLMVRDTHDVVVRYLRLRRGDVTVLKQNAAEGRERPRGSQDLDVVSLDDSRNILFDHCSLSWSCDEILGVVRCENVTIQWCLIAEPLANPQIHPYGDRHACGLNLSASTLSLHHCLIAHYHMRGPQFEANDVRQGGLRHVKFEAINNVLFDYERSGSRYTTGIEDHPEEAVGARFDFQFVNNYYVGAADLPEIEAILKHGVSPQVRVFAAGNRGPHMQDERVDASAGMFTESKLPLREAAPEVRAQLAAQPLFAAPCPVTTTSAAEAYERVLTEAGCSHRRDAVDKRVIENVRQRRFGRVLKSQEEVGGWPELRSSP